MISFFPSSIKHSQMNEIMKQKKVNLNLSQGNTDSNFPHVCSASGLGPTLNEDMKQKKVNLNLSQGNTDSNFDKPKVVSRSQSQKLTTWFSLKSQCPTTHPPPTPNPPTRESFKEAR